MCRSDKWEIIYAEASYLVIRGYSQVPLPSKPPLGTTRDTWEQKEWSLPIVTPGDAATGDKRDFYWKKKPFVISGGVDCGDNWE